MVVYCDTVRFFAPAAFGPSVAPSLTVTLYVVAQFASFQSSGTLRTFTVVGFAGETSVGLSGLTAHGVGVIVGVSVGPPGVIVGVGVLVGVLVGVGVRVGVGVGVGGV